VFARAGHAIARSTLVEWVGACGAQLQPLVQALAEELRRHMVLRPLRGAGGHAQARQWQDPYAHFKDVLDLLPTHPASRIDELLPHRWSV
jgi:Transposase IS66 family